MENVNKTESVAVQARDERKSSLERSGNLVLLDVDEVLTHGGFGKFQYIAFFLITLLLMTFGYQAVLSYFVVNDPAWKCISNSTSAFCVQHFGKIITPNNKLYSQRCLLNRTEWDYVVNKHFSIVTEFDLVCENTALYALISSIYHVGGAVGIFISGLAADRFGRKYVLILFLSILTLASVFCSYITTVWQLIILRAFLGSGEVSAYSISYVYLSEVVPPAYRAVTGIGFAFGYVFSELMINTIAYFCRYWRVVQLYASLPCIVGIILMFFMPKSPRWLMATQNEPEAVRTLKEIITINKKSLPPFELKKTKDGDTDIEACTYWHLFKTVKVTALTLLLSFLWLTAAMAYYTITFESSNLGGNMYETFGFTTLGELPSKFVAYFILNRFGRKKSTLTALVLTSGFAAATRLIPISSAKYVLDITFMACARLFADVNIIGLYLWSFEVFPTVIRLQGVGVCMIFEKAGGFAAPFLTSVLHQINASLPYIILLISTIVSAGCSWFVLPETCDKPTREKYEDFFERKADGEQRDEDEARV